jgi:predicted DNA-binding transcriptional regulator YafY
MMEPVLDPTARSLRLLSLLQTHRFWPGGELAERLGVSARTLRRDIDRLRVLGYPVDATPGAAGGYRLAAGTHMPPLLLDDDEAVAIAVGLRAAAVAAVEGMEDISLRALAKLEQVLPDRLRRRVSAVYGNVAVVPWEGSVSAVDTEALAVLSQACRDREAVRFEYQRRDGDEARRLVHPYQLVSVRRRWYLVAWDVRRADWRTFRVDRLSEPRLAGTRFAPLHLPAADAASYVESSLRSLPMPHEVSVLIGVGAADASAIARWLDARVEPVDDARSRVRLRSESPEWLASLVALLAAFSEIELEEVPGGDGRFRKRLSDLGGRLSRAG